MAQSPASPGRSVRRRRPRRVAVRAALQMLESRLLLSSISGMFWNDDDGDGIRDAGEAALSGWTTYLDQNRNHRRDPGETAATTDANGQYTLTGLAAGTYYVAQEMPLGWSQTFPGVPTAQPAAAFIEEGGISVTYTGSETVIRAGGLAVSAGAGVLPPISNDLESNPLIGLNQLQADPRFTGIDGRGFSIVIIDTGIDVDHPFFGPDMDGNGIADRIVYQQDFVNGDNDASDDHGHGSNVASIAAGEDTGAPGMAPGAGIIALKVLDDLGTGTFAQLESALQWVVAHAATYNIAAVNLSLGDSGNYNSASSMYGLGDELAALAGLNVIVASAAGNGYFSDQSPGVSYPAADANALAVGAVYDSNIGAQSYGTGATDYTTAADRITSFSQRSPAVLDIFAPGAWITGANSSGGIVLYSGTSQATPHVAGLATLAQQLAMQELGRRLTPAEFRNLLQTSGTLIFDGDDENDNVINTLASYRRVNALALASAIYDQGGEFYAYGHRIDLGAAQDLVGADFGDRPISLVLETPILDVTSDTGISASDGLTFHDNSSLPRKLTFYIGGTVPGAILLVYAGDRSIGSMTATGRMATFISNGAVDLVDGLHQIRARQVVPGLPSGPYSADLTITIDTLPPPAPAGLDLETASDSGVSGGDNITNDPTPTFSFTATPYFRFLQNGTVISTSQEIGSSFTTPQVASDGTFNFGVSSVDEAGNASSPASLNVTIDTHHWNPGGTAVGEPDPTFDTDGARPAYFAGGEFLARLLPQPGGKMLAVASTSDFIAEPSSIVLMRFNANGQNDMTFGTDSCVYLSKNWHDRAHDAVLQPDGKVVIAGSYFWPVGPNTYKGRAMLMRCNPDGTLDTTFGVGGRVEAPDTVTGGLFEWYSVQLQPDGRIVVAGDGSINGFGYAVARYLPNGALDTSFDGDGVVYANWTPAPDLARTMQLQADGSIVVSGLVANGGAYNIALLRLTSTGQYDTSFGDNGRVQHPLPGGLSYNSAAGRTGMVIREDGGILLAGAGWSTGITSYSRPVLARLSSNGALDTSFGDGGFVIEKSLPTELYGSNHAIVEDSQGRILVASGSITNPPYGAINKIVMSRYFADGSLDTAFGTSGRTVSFYSSGVNGLTDLYFTADYKLMGAGNIWPESTVSNLADILLIRYQLESPLPLMDLSTSSDNGVSNSDNLTSDTTPTFSLPSAQGHYYRIYRDGQLASGPWHIGSSITWPVPPSGTTHFTYQVVDPAGNASPMSDPLELMIDSVAPTVASATFDNSNRQAVQFNFSEDVISSITPSDLAVVNLTTGMPVPGSEWDLTTTLGPGNETTATWSFNAGILPDGNYQVTLNGISDVAGNPLAFDTGQSFFILAADANRDRVVDLRDLYILSLNWLQTGKTFGEGDFNYDGIVNKLDLTILAERWQIQLDPPSAPPSPAPTATRGGRASTRSATRVIDLVQ